MVPVMAQPSAVALQVRPDEGGLAAHAWLRSRCIRPRLPRTVRPTCTTPGGLGRKSRRRPVPRERRWGAARPGMPSAVLRIGSRIGLRFFSIRWAYSLVGRSSAGCGESAGAPAAERCRYLRHGYISNPHACTIPFRETPQKFFSCLCRLRPSPPRGRGPRWGGRRRNQLCGNGLAHPISYVTNIVTRLSRRHNVLQCRHLRSRRVRWIYIRVVMRPHLR